MLLFKTFLLVVLIEVQFKVIMQTNCSMKFRPVSSSYNAMVIHVGHSKETNLWRLIGN